jgi:hypothetical protein
MPSLATTGFYGRVAIHIFKIVNLGSQIILNDDFRSLPGPFDTRLTGLLRTHSNIRLFVSPASAWIQFVLRTIDFLKFAAYFTGRFLRRTTLEIFLRHELILRRIFGRLRMPRLFKDRQLVHQPRRVFGSSARRACCVPERIFDLHGHQ